MIEREFSYINGNTAVQPKRKVGIPKRKKPNEDIRKIKKRREKLKKEKEFKQIIAIAQIVTTVFVLGAITIYRDGQVYSMKKNFQKITSDIKLLDAENEAMRVDLLKNSSLKNIEETAKQKVKMIDGKEAKSIEVDLSTNHLGELMNNK